MSASPRWYAATLGFALPEFLESMFCFLSKTIHFRRHIIKPISPTFQQLLCVHTQWFSARYCNSNASNGHSFTVSYLIGICGFSPQEAASASKRISFETRERPDMVIKFLKNQGLSQPQILRFIREAPEFLRYDPEKTFLPKIEFFKSKGVSSSHIPKLISSCPNIMRRSLSKQLIPSFDFFRDLFQSDDKLIKVLRDFSGILLDMNTLTLPNMKLLREVGVPESNVIKLLQFFPRVLTRSPVRFQEIVEELKEMGFDPLRVKFVMAVYALSSMSKSTWARKANAYKKWGWSDSDIRAAFIRNPFCMKASENKIDAIMEFLVNNMGCHSSSIARCPLLISMSLNKRIVPRASVFQVLLSRGRVRKERLLSIFTCSERHFLERFVLRHEKEASELLRLYREKLEYAE